VKYFGGFVRANAPVGNEAGLACSDATPPQVRKPFWCFNSSPQVIRLVVLMYVRFPLSLRNVEDLLFERGIDLYHVTVRFWWKVLPHVTIEETS
jgi:hypothetical protein